MQATLVSAFTAFSVVTAHGGQPVGPRPGNGPVRPTPSGPGGRPVRPQPGNPFGCPQGIQPELGSYCSQPGTDCNYPGQSYSCSWGNKWIAKPSNPALCYKDGHSYEDGYEFINIQGCVEWECENGNIEYNSCPPPAHGCYKNGKTYPNHYQPPPDATGCVDWQCENGKIRYNPCPAQPVAGCWRNGYYYTDGFIQYSNDGRHCPIWECLDGHIQYLGNCPEKQGCYKDGMKYSDGFTKYTHGCATWTCSNGTIRYLGGCPQPPSGNHCEYNGRKVQVGTRVNDYKSSGLNCAKAICNPGPHGQPAKFECIFG